MIWKKYENELIVLLAFLVLIFAISYKNIQIATEAETSQSVKKSTSEFKELLALKKRWLNKKTGKKLDKLKSMVPPEKVSWHKKGKKLSAVYKNLTAKELDKLVTVILNQAVQIQKLNITRKENTYTMEFKCKW